MLMVSMVQVVEVEVVVVVWVALEVGLGSPLPKQIATQILTMP